MLLQLTVIDARAPHERTIEVRAEEHHTLADLLVALDLPPDASVHVDGTPCDRDSPVGLPPLLEGATLVLRHGDEPPRSPDPAPLRLTTTTGPDAGLSLDLTPGRHLVGRGDAATLRPEDPALSREHFSLDVDRDGVLVRDRGTTNGTCLDGSTIPPGGTRVRAGSQLRAGHTTFVLEARRVRPSRRRPTGAGTLAVNPTPHVPPARPPVRITIPQEPRKPRGRRIPWTMVILPLPFAGLLALFFGPRMLLFGLLTPMLAIASTLSDRSTSRRDHREEHAAWTRDRARAGARLTTALAAERRHRLLAAPDAMTLLDAARGDSTRLWERRPTHDEHLDLRLGLGPLPATVEVDRGGGDRPHPVLEGVPLVVDLEEVGVLGIAGPRAVRDRLARHLLGQLTVLHSHHDVRLSVVAEGPGWWAPFAGLAHLREHDDVPGSSRATADPEHAAAVLGGLARVTRERAAVQQRPGTAPTTLPTLVLVVDGTSGWRADAGLRTILADGSASRVHVIALADTTEELPHECGAIAVLEGDEVRLQVAGTDAAKGVVDGTGPAWTTRLTSALAPLRDATPDAAGGGVPTATRLLDLIGLDPDDPSRVRELWSRPEDPGRVDLDVVVGAGSDGEHRIDLRRDGPHALVAGTTGSGKSEFLQSWVASLATRLSPEEICFVLVDYKGGSAFAECARLPHTVGLLTDLDPEQAERALTSLDAELTRRERILAASGAKDIDAHRGEPLPRLMIIIDEFRMLAEEQPDALAHLMKIAAVGRSLGVHLVLATQRPGGIVSADIKANVNLRIALRVRDRIDSDDVLGVPDAVDIPEEAPGRALARTGGSPPRTFQTGRVAGHAPTLDDGILVRAPGEAWPTPPRRADPGPTDLQRLTGTIATASDDLGIREPHRPWLPPLGETLAAGDLAAGPDLSGSAPFALLDRPELQQQVPLGWSPTGGHWMVVGGPGTGRTTSIASVVTAAARTWTPERIHIQVLGDGSAALAGLADLPHVGSVVDGEDLAVASRFLERLDADVADRRGPLPASGDATLDAWRAAYDAHPTGEAPPPHLLLAIDGWGRITQPRGSVDLGETAEMLETLLRDGTAAGLRALVTGGREMFSGRISSLMSTRLVLHLPDRGDATLAGLKPAEQSTRPVAGRARRQPGGHLLQVALPDASSAPLADGHHDGLPPWVVEPLPEESSLDALPVATRERLPVGVGGRGREPVVWLTPGARRLLVCGPARSGRSTALATLARQALTAGHPLALVASDDLTHPDLAGCPRFGAEDREGLIDLRREHPDLAVVVDDADRVEEAPVAEVLREILRRVDADGGLVLAAASTQTAAAQFRGLVPEIGRSRTGILLNPSSRSDGDALGLRVPPLPRLPGRGYLIAEGQAEEIQVAR